MSEKTVTTKSAMPSLVSILTVTFVLAKLTGVITWSWWLVFAPLLVSWAVGMLALLLILISAVIVAVVER